VYNGSVRKGESTMYYRALLEGYDESDRLWFRQSAGAIEIAGSKDAFLVKVDESPERFIKELAESGCTADFSAISKDEFDSAVGYVS
jgi:hypothetical protein